MESQEYQTEEKKQFRLTRGMVLLAVIALIVIVVVIIIVVNQINSKKPEYTPADFKKLESRMEEEAPTYISQSGIVLTNEETKIDLKKLLLENGGSIDSNATKAAKICEGYVLASKVDTEKYISYIKCGKFYTTDGYVSEEQPSTTKTPKKDTEKPIVTINGEKEITISAGSNYFDGGAKAIDNIDGDITSNIKVSGSVNTNSPGTYTITYSVSDKAGNKAEAKRVVTVTPAAPITTTTTKAPTTTRKSSGTVRTTTKKTVITTQRVTTPPTITLRGEVYVSLNVGSRYKDSGYYAVDAKGSDITSRVRVSGSVNISIPGTYKITYSVTDSYGNNASTVRTVVVKSTYIKLQSISLTPNTVVLTKGKQQKLSVLYSPSNASNKTISWSSSNTSVATVSNGTITARNKGVAKITAKAADGVTVGISVTVK